MVYALTLVIDAIDFKAMGREMQIEKEACGGLMFEENQQKR